MIQNLPLIFILGVLLLIVVTTYKPFIQPWIRAKMLGVEISFGDLFAMWNLKVPGNQLVDAAFFAKRSKLQVKQHVLVAHYAAGGDAMAVLGAMRAAQEENLELSLDRARAYNLMSPEGGPLAILEKTRQESTHSLERLKGKTGLVVERFVPSGIVEIEGQRYDVESEAGLLDQGTQVSVVQIEGNRIRVHPAPQEL